ncbi:MAG: tyrosine-type recombinase/integrase, partial [Beijerinckiaceae bacterium]
MARKPPKLEHVKWVLRRGKWYAYFNTGQKLNGRPIRKPMPPWGSDGFFPSYAAFKAGRTKRQEPAYTVATMADEYQRSAEFADKAPNTRQLYDNQLFKIVDAWGKFPVDSLRPAEVRLVLDNAGWNAGTRNMVTAVLGALYTWGRRRGKASVWPTKDIERSKGGEHEPWPEDILEAGLASEGIVRLAVHLLYFTGLRIGDACNLRWGDIRKDKVYVTPQKTKRHGKRLTIPLMAELKAELDRTPRTHLLILGGISESKL